MAIPIPSPLVEFILLGPLDDRRQLQDSPILGDVWVEYAKQPDQALDLLIVPYRAEHPGAVAAKIDNDLKSDNNTANIAFLQGLVVARLYFVELMRVVAPKTKWWISRWSTDEDSSGKKKRGKKKAATPTHLVSHFLAKRAPTVLTNLLDSAKKWHAKTAIGQVYQYQNVDRFFSLIGLILWAAKCPSPPAPVLKAEDQIDYILSTATATEIISLMTELTNEMLADGTKDPLIWQVSLNRKALPALDKSVPAVKADAAKFLFKVNCTEIGWAVLDSGIDGKHDAFQTKDGSRVKRSFDFKNFRRIVSISNLKDAIRAQNVQLLMASNDLLRPPPNPDEALKRLADDASNGGPLHWELIEQFVEIKPETPPATNHGTHVAGIIGASKEAAAERNPGRSDFVDGLCPDISLYDFRVLGPDITETEFAIIAALQLIRYLNEKDHLVTIHGANLSLSIPHDVRNFACGRTPICDECERLIASGVVVVAAAGNHGYKSFQTAEGSFDTYAAFSITDPGNADGVLTVGATHRFWPHTYGISFFSSRGPTGDGRLKPDLVAPGEKIRSTFPDNEWNDLDGTSMAAPHVSGAAAMLMARYSELVGQPLRVKRLLCETATDLGRERSFQGHGMLDVLRAFQAI